MDIDGYLIHISGKQKKTTPSRVGIVIPKIWDFFDVQKMKPSIIAWVVEYYQISLWRCVASRREHLASDMTPDENTFEIEIKMELWETNGRHTQHIHHRLARWAIFILARSALPVSIATLILICVILSRLCDNVTSVKFTKCRACVWKHWLKNVKMWYLYA